MDTKEGKQRNEYLVSHQPHGCEKATTADLAEGESTFSGEESEPVNFAYVEIHFCPKFLKTLERVYVGLAIF